MPLNRSEVNVNSDPHLSISHLLRMPRGQFVRYVLIGLVTTIFSVVILVILYDWLRYLDAVSANFVAGVAGIPLSYALNRRWVWGRVGKSHLASEVVPFWVASIIALIFAVLAAQAARALGDHYGFGRGTRTLLILGFSVLFNVALFVGKYFAYSRIFSARGLPLGESVASGR